ncbi:MAG: right-handed parallel beta-helix repeat-containing protein [Acidimicrobiales bacterium]
MVSSRGAKLGVIFSMVLTLVGLGTTGVAHGAFLGCGDIISQSVTLDGDVGPCANFGIIIGANNITLDLNGYEILGTPARGDKVGIYFQRVTGSTVKNGGVSNFDVGVLIEGGSANTVTNVAAVNNQGGGAGTFGGDGIAITSSTNNRVIGNKAANNGPYSGIGLYSLVDSAHPRTVTGRSTGNLIENNDVLDNFAPRPGGGPESTDNDGIRVENQSTDNTFRGNRVSGSGLDGIALFADSGNNLVQGNFVQNNGFFRTAIRRGNGIVSFNRANGNRIEGNYVTNNADNGIVIQGPLGNIPGSLNNQVLYNTSVGNSARPPLATTAPAFIGPTFDLQDRNPNCDNNLWFGNRYRTANPPCTTTGGQQV